MFNVVLIYRDHMSMTNIVNCSSLTYNSANNTYTIVGALASSPTTQQTFTFANDGIIIRIMQNG